MEQIRSALRALIDSVELGSLPSLGTIVDSMDGVAWLLTFLMVAAIGVGTYFALSTRRTFVDIYDVETTPALLLEELKRDPTLLPPSDILRKLGAEATLELLEFGDRADDPAWRFRWGSIRNDLIYLLSQQNAFGTIYALARYYRSEDKGEPDTIRIRRTVLIHKLGITRFLQPNEQGAPSELRIRHHPSEVIGDLGFQGSAIWLIPDEPASPPRGPLLEMDPIEFHTLEAVDIHIHIRQTPMIGGGFKISLEKRREMWIVVKEEIEWAS
ncbi:MAG: hypothetical protein AAF702_20155 [Chloroflexota bacterium]